MKHLIRFLILLNLIGGADVALGQMTSVNRAEIRDTNLLGPYNSGFENGKQGWTASGGTFAVTTSALDGVKSATWTPSATSQTLDSTAVTIPIGLRGGNCVVNFLYNGSDANLTFEVYDVTAVGIVAGASQVLSTVTVPTIVTIPFQCPNAADSIKVRLVSSAASAQITFDKTFLGLSAYVQATTISPVVYSQAKSVIVANGTAGFNPAGHVLTTTEWPFTVASNLAFYNFNSSTTTDNSGGLSCTAAACTLTATGSPTISGANYFGTSSSALGLNGTTQYVQSTNAFFNPGDVDFSYGGWFMSTTWSGIRALISQESSTTTDTGFKIIWINTTDGIQCRGTNSATSYDTTVNTYYVPTANEWVHVAAVYTAATNTIRCFINGKVYGTGVVPSGQRTVTTPKFSIGISQNGPGEFFNGNVNDVFYGKYALTDDDVRKLYSRAIAHNLNTPAASQRWMANWYRADSLVANQMTPGWIVHKGADTLYADFSDIAAGAFVDFNMENQGMTAWTIPIGAYDSGWLSSTPGTTLAHGLGAFPDNIVIGYESNTPSAGNYQFLNAGDYCSFDNTNLYCDWDSLTVGGSNLIRITAWRGNVNATVQAASATTSGVVNTTTQAFAGTKNFTGSVGIGSATPAQALDVVKNGDYPMRLQNSATGGGFWNVGPTDNAFNVGGNRFIIVPNSTSSTNRLLELNTDGSVILGGINVSNAPYYKSYYLATSGLTTGNTLVTSDSSIGAWTIGVDCINGGSQMFGSFRIEQGIENGVAARCSAYGVAAASGLAVGNGTITENSECTYDFTLTGITPVLRFIWSTSGAGLNVRTVTSTITTCHFRFHNMF